MTYPKIEEYRNELRSKLFDPMSPHETAELRRFYYSDQFSEMIGERPSPETFALLNMFLAERVPPDISEPFLMRYVCEQVVMRTVRDPGKTIQ